MSGTPVSRRGVLMWGAAIAPAWAWATEEAIARYERDTGGRLGLYAFDTATGRDLAWRADERFTMCSTFKASLAAFVLSRVDAGREQGDRLVRFGPADLQPYAPAARAALARGAMTVQQMCQAAVELSDNTCANLLLHEVGGPAALTRFWRIQGDSVSRLDHDEPMLNRSRPPDARDTTTPRAMARTLARLSCGDALLPASRTRLADWMVACQTGTRKLRAGLPPGWRVGDKTGSNGADASGDIAVAWPPAGGPVAMSVYVQGGRPSPAQQEEAMAFVGRLVARLFA